MRLTPEVVDEIGWLPPTCGYRLVADGRDLYWWHPLVSGDPDTVHAAGISVRGRVSASEDDVVPPDTLEDHIVSWPLRWPKRAREPAPASEAKGRPREALKPSASAGAAFSRDRATAAGAAARSAH